MKKITPRALIIKLSDKEKFLKAVREIRHIILRKTKIRMLADLSSNIKARKNKTTFLKNLKNTVDSEFYTQKIYIPNIKGENITGEHKKLREISISRFVLQIFKKIF